MNEKTVGDVIKDLQKLDPNMAIAIAVENGETRDIFIIADSEMAFASIAPTLEELTPTN